MNLTRILIFVFSMILPGLGWGQENVSLNRYRVAVAVADLRRNPVEAAGTLEQDPLQESQLLYGEPVDVLEDNGRWMRVCAILQSEWSHNQQWEGYPGWVRSDQLIPEPRDWNPNLVVTSKIGTIRSVPSTSASAELELSMGSLLQEFHSPNSPPRFDFYTVKLLNGTIGWIAASEVFSASSQTHPPHSLRSQLVKMGRPMVGTPYYWGGRSGYAIDCSGLVGLLHQALGIMIPRDSHEQWMQAKPLSEKELSAGDLVFLFDEKDPERVTHVMLYTDKETVIEAPGTGQKVREIPLAKRLKQAQGRRVAYGTFLP